MVGDMWSTNHALVACGERFAEFTDDRWRPTKENRRKTATGEPVVLHIPAVTCLACLVSYDQLLEIGLAGAVKHNGATVALVSARATPDAPAPKLSMREINDLFKKVYDGHIENLAYMPSDTFWSETVD